MCATSAISDYYTRQWPDRYGYNPFLQPATTGPLPVVDAETKEMMRKVLQLLDKIDKRLGDIECMDAEKAAFLKALDLDPTNLGG